ncbi:MAG: zf-TFIIB domain-containing protein [Desulfobacterales bacterium]|nr:zf-TFIIB domain-containing protein [Desulfobacterales bacterium]
MQCPQCKEPMKCSSIDGIIISECSCCKGMWFENGQLEDVKDEILPDMGWLEIETWKEQAEFQAGKALSLCPKCRDITLAKIKNSQSTVEIKICTACNGTWLDAGQFLYLVNALLDEANKKSAPEFVKISLQQAKEMLTGSDSIVSDWQDLKMVLALLRHRIFVQHPMLKSVIMGLQKSLPL